MRELLPIGEYEYNKDDKSFDEAWSQLREAYEKKQSIICLVTEYSEDNRAVELDYYGIKGIIKSGYITQNRLLHNEDLVGKTTCVYIYNINDRKKTFVGTRLRVEQEAKSQLSILRCGDIVEGVLKNFGNQESFALIDIKEGIQAYLSVKKVTRVPFTCRTIKDYMQIGDHVKGKITFIEPYKTPKHDTYCVISLLDMEENWENQVANLHIGSTVSGYPLKDLLFANKYYIEYSRNVCIEFNSDENLDKTKCISVRIGEIDSIKYKIYAELEVEDKQQLVESESNISDTNEEKNSSLQGETISDKEQTMSMFRRQIKSEISPFKMRTNEAKDFNSTPNRYVSMRYIWNRIAQGQVKEEHFGILEAVNYLIYGTSKQILSYIYCEKKKIKIKNQDKLNGKLDSMVKLAMIDRFKFYNETGKGIYYVYFLNKNGHLVLQSYLHNRRTSYEPGLIAKTAEEIKRHLAANQVVLAYKETFDFVQCIYNYRTIKANEEVPIRPATIIQFVNSTLLVEARRRFDGWEEDLHDKMDRYQILFHNHDTQKLPAYTPGFLNMPLYLLLVCEDFEHALEAKNTLFGHTMYTRLYFTYDTLIFQTDVNTSIFRFEGTGQNIIYYNLTELFHYNIEQRSENIWKVEEEDSKDVVDKFKETFQKNYMAGLSYLQSKDCKELRDFVQLNLQELYRIEGEEYQTVYPEEKQYFVYLLYLINKDLITNLSAAFYESERGKGENVEGDTDESIELTENVLQEDMQHVSEKKTKPDELEEAVKLVLLEIEKWMKATDWRELNMSSSFHYTQHPMRQTTGLQFGYDVGMIFTYKNEEYHLGFECKSHERVNESGSEKRLTISDYAYNLLQYYMYCKREKNAHNYWILVCPFRDFQNNIHENLFQTWNQENSVMQIRAFSRSQTEIACENFLSLNEDAYRLVYKHEPPKFSPQDKNDLMKKIFLYIVDKEKIQRSDSKQLPPLSIYPFMGEYNTQQEVMPLRTVDGEDVLEKLLQKLGEGKSVFLIGEYGSGKTYLTYLLVKTILAHEEVYEFFPLWFKLIESSIDLGTNSVTTSVTKFIEEGMQKYSGYLGDDNKKKMLIILDGLDEIIFGLEESTKKIQFLQEVYRVFRKKYNNVLFVITSREKDFKSCSNFREFKTGFDHFVRIVIGDCRKEDAVERLLAAQNAIADTGDSNNILKELSTNSDLVNIARKPLYFGFLRDLIREETIYDCKDEIDILDKIIKYSVQHYLNSDDSNKSVTEQQIMGRLFTYARRISEQLGKGESDECIDFRHSLTGGFERNVIQLTYKNNDEYRIRFYHNAIREYLVAKSLYEKMKSQGKAEVKVGSELWNWLKDLDMTPETIDFFCKLVDKELTDKKQIAELLIRILKTAKKSELKELGTHVISLLFHLQPKISDQDFSGIYAHNVFLWNCSLKNVNFMNAHLQNMSLFNVNLDGVDFRGADLSGLLIGTEGEVLDAKYINRNEKIVISVLYSDGQIVDYTFLDTHDLNTYTIVCRMQLPAKEYNKMCLLEDDILVYSGNKAAFISDIDKTFNMEQGYQLIYIDKRSVMIEKDDGPYLVWHNQRYQQRQIRRLPEGEYKDILVINRDLYLYVRDRKLFLQREFKTFLVTDLNLQFECFTAWKRNMDDEIIVYVKYRDEIQIIQYNLINGDKEYDSKSLPEYHNYTKMTAISEKLLYGVSEQTVFLHDLSNTDNLIPLKIEVKCHNLVLESQSGIDRVQGDVEYQILKNSTM